VARGPARAAATIHFTITGSPDGAVGGGLNQPNAATHGGNGQGKQAPGDSRKAGIKAAVGRVRVAFATMLTIHGLNSLYYYIFKFSHPATICCCGADHRFLWSAKREKCLGVGRRRKPIVCPTKPSEWCNTRAQSFIDMP